MTMIHCMNKFKINEFEIYFYKINVLNNFKKNLSDTFLRIRRFHRGFLQKIIMFGIGTYIVAVSSIFYFIFLQDQHKM